MKTCSRCQQTKSDDEFSFKGRGKLQYFCRCCVHLYNQEYYAQNKARYIEKARRRNAQQREILRQLVDAAKCWPCADCGVQYPPWIMEFDHLEGADKVANVADMLGFGYSAERVRKEIIKCEVVCANCHRQRTYERTLKAKQERSDPIT